VKRHQNPSADYLLLGATLLLVIFGVLMVYNASVIQAFRDFSDKFYFARLQAIWAGVGFASLLIASRLPLKIIEKLSLPAFIVSVLLLVAVFIPSLGSQIKGAQRWLSLGPITIQPSELVKLTFVMYLATWLKDKQKLWPFLVISGIILGLVMAQPDLGTSIVVITTAFSIYFISGAPITSLIAIGFTSFLSGVGLILSSPYRKQRLLTFFNPTSDPLGASYHIRQILIALGSGGLLGVGIGRSRQKYEYLPEATTDSIFAVIAEEVGFIGSAIIILLFLVILYRGFTIAKNARTPYASLLAAGITSWIGIQTFLNLSAMVALVPLTGLPLPFISYGGSSLISVMTGVGILLNTSKHT